MGRPLKGISFNFRDHPLGSRVGGCDEQGVLFHRIPVVVLQADRFHCFQKPRDTKGFEAVFSMPVR